MSLSLKLIVYNYYDNYTICHKNYGESYQLYKIVNEYLAESSVDGVSCVRRDIETAHLFNAGKLTLDRARQQLDLGKTIASLSNWFRSNTIETDNVSYEVRRVLDVLNEKYAPLEKRKAAGSSIFDIDSFESVPQDFTDNLSIIMDRFYNFVNTNRLLHVANVFDPAMNNVVGWWYNKFCVLTYMHRIAHNTVPKELSIRLKNVVIKHIRLTPNKYYPSMMIADDRDNCATTMASVYGKFCGIGKEHFARHKTASLYVLFQCLRDNVTAADEQFPAYVVIKDFARQCRDTYRDLQLYADSLYINCVTDKQKNNLLDLLCCVNDSYIDVECYDPVVLRFYK
ncbi:hypothetical protein [Perigonia lusca single nucleopolyhedrovirus]|uniref:Uncharacterized protein n=1 Tax=Perigonia lusca single nucleopolyhedrovirus TaxID=1675865 RepID=A0A0M3WPC5_9ABAC|nr:hypothetical protein [Perigonia lusca single nucleopolyhedrovirus]AKN80671.1 hypothetical protein [Perigonia lusca single nucleopolyhedrovirus]